MPRRPKTTQIGNYILHDHISRGGFGSIYRASELGTDNSVLRSDVAIKIMHTFGNQIGSHSLRTWTAKELYGMDFYHANLITYYNKGDSETTDFSQDFYQKLLCGQENEVVGQHTIRRCKIESGAPPEKFIWIAMPFTESGSLHTISKRRFESNNPYNITESIQIIKQILIGIGYLHSRGYIHRDLKPDNVLFFEQDNRWRISDYGLLGKLENGIAESWGGGTPGWMAPEQFGRPVDVRADIYSIGQIFYYLLTGKYHFEFAVHNAPSVNGLMPEIPESLSDLVDKSIQMDPEHRHPDIESLFHDLEEIETGELINKLNTQQLSDRKDNNNIQSIVDWFNKSKNLDNYLQSKPGPIAPEISENSDMFDDEIQVDELTEEELGPGELSLEQFDIKHENIDLWGPCLFYTTLYRVHRSTVRYQHSIGNKRYSIYIPKTLLRSYGFGGQNNEYPLEIKVSYKEIQSASENATYPTDPVSQYWDFKYHDWHSDTLQYRAYVNDHLWGHYRIYVPKVALDSREPKWIRLELEPVD